MKRDETDEENGMEQDRISSFHRYTQVHYICCPTTSAVVGPERIG